MPKSNMQIFKLNKRVYLTIDITIFLMRCEETVIDLANNEMNAI